jgi:hypothetical protein
VRIPNLGINIPAWNVGLRYQPVPFTKDEFIKTKSVADWRKEKIDLHKKPVIFLLRVLRIV